MINLVKAPVRKWKELFDKLDAKVNFSIPENLLSYLWINGRQNDKNLALNENNFRLQIGKMQKDKETIYTDDILLPAIEYILKKTWDNQTVVIQLWPDLAKFLTNTGKEDEAKKILSFEEEKTKIIKLIKKHFKNKLHKIKILSVSDQYPEIFALLKENWKDWLSATTPPVLDNENYSALDIVQYLYRHSQNNPKLIKLFYNTKTTAQKENDTKPIWQNNSDYYSLVEVWIRLYEILKNISIQWWIDRQSKYDQIIGGIIQRKDVDTFKTRDYPELQELSVFWKQTNPGLIFDRLYISTKNIRETVDKKQILSRMQMTMSITALMLFSILVWWFWWYKIFKSKQDADQKKLEEAVIKSALDATSIYFYGVNTKYDYWEDYEKKKEYLENTTEMMYNFFCEVYGTPKNMEFIRSLIINELLRIYNLEQTPDGKIVPKRNIERFFKLPLDRSIMGLNDFVINTLVPNNAWLLPSSWIDPTPYNHFLQYKSDFQNTISIKWNLWITSHQIMWDRIDTNSTWLNLKDKYQSWQLLWSWWFKKEDIWTYYDYHNYNYYHFIKLQTTNGEDIILAAKSSSSYVDPVEGEKFSLVAAKEGIQKIKWYREK